MFFLIDKFIRCMENYLGRTPKNLTGLYFTKMSPYIEIRTNLSTMGFIFSNETEIKSAQDLKL